LEVDQVRAEEECGVEPSYYYQVRVIIVFVSQLAKLFCDL